MRIYLGGVTGLAALMAREPTRPAQRRPPIRIAAAGGRLVTPDRPASRPLAWGDPVWSEAEQGLERFIDLGID